MPPFPQPESPAEFKYSGWLSFYPFKTDVKGDFTEITSQADVEQILHRKLPKYEQGRPTAPGDGFRIANTPELLSETGSLNEYPLLDDLVHIKYIQESYQSRIAYDEQEDDFVETNTVEISTSDLFWIYPQYLFTRSSKQKSDHVRSRMRSILVNSLRTEKVEFERDFIIWLLYKDYTNDEIDSEMSLRQLQSIKLQREGDTIACSDNAHDFGFILTVGGDSDKLGTADRKLGVYERILIQK